MCYVCSPKCDNCYPKVVVCPECGTPCQLGMDICIKCHRPISQDEKDKAIDEWNHGKRFLAKNNGDTPEFAKRMKERLELQKKRAEQASAQQAQAGK